jgi:hypothetical protein
MQNKQDYKPSQDSLKEMQAYMRTGKFGKRRFSVITLQLGEVIQFCKKDLSRFQFEFPTAARKLYAESNAALKILISRYIASTKRQEEEPSPIAIQH